MYQNPPFSVSKASTLHIDENNNNLDIFQYDGQNWESFEQDAGTLAEQEIMKPSIIFSSSRTFRGEHMAKLCNQFEIPDVFWTRTSCKASGYFGFKESFDAEGNVTGYSSWLRFIVKITETVTETSDRDKNLPILYHWDKIKVACKSNVMLCFDMPPDFKTVLKKAVIDSYSDFERDPFSLSAILIPEVIALFDRSVWLLRNLVRTVERDRAFTERPNPDYFHFHEISRHVIHSTETLSMAVKSLESMIEQHKNYLQDTAPHTGKTKAIGRHVQQSLLYQKSLAQCLKGRSEALGLRLQNEINLAFNTVSQYDSQTAVKIGQAAQSDSASMRAISVMTFIFFPGTFISSILGMNFFNFSPGDNGTPQKWSVSDHLWIFFALTIPLTLITGITWFFWQRRSDRSRAHSTQVGARRIDAV